MFVTVNIKMLHIEFAGMIMIYQYRLHQYTA